MCTIKLNYVSCVVLDNNVLEEFYLGSVHCVSMHTMSVTSGWLTVAAVFLEKNLALPDYLQGSCTLTL